MAKKKKKTDAKKTTLLGVFSSLGRFWSFQKKLQVIRQNPVSTVVQLDPKMVSRAPHDQGCPIHLLSSESFRVTSKKQVCAPLQIAHHLATPHLPSCPSHQETLGGAEGSLWGQPGVSTLGLG